MIQSIQIMIVLYTLLEKDMPKEKQPVRLPEEGEEYISIGEAAKRLGVERPVMYYYINALKIEKFKFPLDKKRYLKMPDFEQIRTLKEQADKRREAEGSAA